jgi:hypothetical protein
MYLFQNTCFMLRINNNCHNSYDFRQTTCIHVCKLTDLIQWSSPHQAAGYLERNFAEALPAFALTSYGAVASPFYRAEAFGEGRSSLQQAAEYPGEGE